MSVNWDAICREIEAKRKLTPAEERMLWNAWQDGSEKAREELIACTMRFALGPAKHYAKEGQRWEPGDLLGEAVQAISGALERWDGGGCFAAYALPRIRGTMQDFLRRKANVMRCPAGSERVLSLDTPGEFADGWKETHGEGGTESRGFDATFSVDLPDMPVLTKRESQILALTVLATPPGSPADAAAALKLSEATVCRLLRAALRKAPRQGCHADR